MRGQVILHERKENNVEMNIKDTPVPLLLLDFKVAANHTRKKAAVVTNEGLLSRSETSVLR
jgi:hypothetical protein